MLTAIVLTSLAVLCRVLTSSMRWWNFAPVGALSLFAGSRLPRRWAWVVPVLAMAISDVLLDHYRYRPFLNLTRLTIYATFAATTLLGPLANRPERRRWLLPALSLSGSTLFFLTSNLATWAEGHLYPITFSGLMLCYVAAIPFFARTIAGDLVGTALFFGLGPVIEQAARRLTHHRLAEIRSEVHTPKSSGPS